MYGMISSSLTMFSPISQLRSMVTINILLRWSRVPKGQSRPPLNKCILLITCWSRPTRPTELALFFYDPIQPTHQRPILLLCLCHARLSKTDFASARYTLRQQRQIGAHDGSNFRIPTRRGRVCHHHDGLSIRGNLDCAHCHPF